MDELTHLKINHKLIFDTMMDIESSTLTKYKTERKTFGYYPSSDF